MKCIVGLGNPGRKFKKTRHNIGFMVIDELVDRHNWKLKKDKFNGKSTVEFLGNEKVILLQPQTYMNLSGGSIRPLIDFYNIAVDDVLVIYDDLDLPTGKIRLRQKGSHGGHNGIRSTIEHLGTKEFKRLRIGIGRPSGQMQVVDYVLGSFPKEKHEAVDSGIQKAADACEAWLEKSFSEVMNEFNN
ncbi:peptidyl-tRNA hydrolase [Virgibacillus subterraneus]|uniref:Peptidyl-tRNA hydrolase n=2 Tax=Virgibacillus TaxID=84406 RepID=A0A1H0XN81_9BACI|nr:MULTISPECIES: aminoacyl-tRNA hydrolase [Virgibacillus]SDQ04271.1 peptidyl-tRNA hydrolase [Virgibacillus salinus]SEQ98777.1 peptidyl-tRNA hydrolase [Virgibacillus subterraneus]